ncbi:MAG: hypothetical protein LC122_13445 [Chitinophagales bacterium]|nr:hypothetical protein [Chitinophagales bacterium]
MRKIFSLMFAGLICFISFPGCGGSRTPPRPTPVVKDTDLCEAAGKNLVEQHCILDDRKFTKLGKSFKLFCEETQSAGVFLNPRCLSEIKASNVSECHDKMNVCTYSK